MLDDDGDDDDDDNIQIYSNTLALSAIELVSTTDISTKF